ncbi:eukaryotic translation initiation factor [Scheffersomyces amazonensis]|uniref:eukaryotic translation initiation factor n=1 Tax=Scheffersomyces amazonensis TaxID=1078765 RepID=UPI00315D54E0
MVNKQGNKKYQAPTATSINVESSVLLSLIRHTSENYPSLFSGTLLGFEDDEGSIDITHVYPFPYPDQYEGGSFKSRSGAKYQDEILESLKKLGYGVEFQGWFQSTVSGNFVTTQLIEGLAQQQLLNKNSFIIIHNLSSINKEVELKALRLSEGFIGAYLDGKWKSKDLESNKISYLNIFDELPINIHNQNLINLYLSNLQDSTTTVANTNEFEVVNLSSNQNVTAQLLESLYSQVDSYNYDQNNFNYYQRQNQKEVSKVTQWKQQRKLENLERAKRGESELDPEEWKSIFRFPSEPSRYNNILHSHAIDVLADDILKKCEEDLTKSLAIERKLISEN